MFVFRFRRSESEAYLTPYDPARPHWLYLTRVLTSDAGKSSRIQFSFTVEHPSTTFRVHDSLWLFLVPICISGMYLYELFVYFRDLPVRGDGIWSGRMVRVKVTHRGCWMWVTLHKHWSRDKYSDLEAYSVETNDAEFLHCTNDCGIVDSQFDTSQIL